MKKKNKNNDNKILLVDVLSDTEHLLTKKRPSNFLPFRGNFPLLSEAREVLFRIGIEGKTYLEECDDWIQQVLIKAHRISTIEKEFFEFLKSRGNEVKYNHMNGKQKAAEIKKYFATTTVDVEDLVVKDSEYSKL